jgi:hypothetical protein
MSESLSTVVLLVRPGANPRRASEIRRWIRALVPAAFILVSSVPIDLGAAGGVVTISADELDAGPLAVAAALARPRRP